MYFSITIRCPRCERTGNVHSHITYDMSGKSHLNFTFNRTDTNDSTPTTGRLSRITTPLAFPTSVTIQGIQRSFKPHVVVFFTGNHYICLLRADPATDSEDGAQNSWVLFNDDTVSLRTLEYAVKQRRASQICQLVYIPS